MIATAPHPARRLIAPIAFAALAACALTLLFSLALVSSASAAPPELWTKCEVGSAAGQCTQPRGIAANPENGHVFVADNFNSRVVELNALGEFVKTWGWDVVASGPGNTGTGFEICVPEEGDVCKAGATGGGAGQFNVGVMGVALDSSGDVYVVDRNNHRVQKFSPAGQFLLMFGKGVNSGTSGNPEICTSAGPPTDVCATGAEGTGNGQFGAWAVGSFIAIDPADKLYVGDQNRIQRFNAAGAYQDQCSVPGTVQSLATDSSGSLYAVYNNQLGVRKLSFLAGGECQQLERFDIPKPGPQEPFPSAVAVDTVGHVFAFGPTCSVCSGSRVEVDPIVEFNAAGNVIDSFGKEEFQASTGLATNLCPGSEAPGDLYVSNTDAAKGFVRAYGTAPVGCFKARTLPATNVAETAATLNGTVNPGGSLSAECRFEWGTTTAYGHTAPCAETPAQIGAGAAPVPVHADIGPLAAATVYHFRLRAKVNGVTETGPDLSFKTLGPPTIADQHVVSATYTEASLKALVNPEGSPTVCHVDYGLDASYGNTSPSLPAGSDRGDHPLTVLLSDLQPGTTYHWRFACANSAALNGGLTQGEDRTLATYRSPEGPQPCANDALRGGASASLPDCRAYEMVSPVDKNGADIVAGARFDAGSEGYVQVAPDGNRIAYAAQFPAFADSANSFQFNQYLAAREAGGWSTHALHPPYTGHRLPSVPTGVFREFIAFSPDLCSAWLLDSETPPLNPDGQDDVSNLYRRQNCGPEAGSFETLTTAPLAAGTNPQYVDVNSVQGVSDDSRHALFLAEAKLTPEARDDTPAFTDPQIYDRFAGALHLVSVLPGGTADPTRTAVGSGQDGNLRGALSPDGSWVYWTSGVGSDSTGKIYLRHHPEQGIVTGECNNAGTKACTFPVSTGSHARFWAASPDASRALYSEGEDLYSFDLAESLAGEPPKLIAHHVKNFAGPASGVLGASEYLDRVYFLSTDALPGSGQNSEGSQATAGQPNLYLYQAADVSPHFVATLVAGDVGAKEAGGIVTAYNLGEGGTLNRATRVSPDGSRIAFQSRAPLTDFDNAASGSGRPAVEVYLYQAAGPLLCVSCNPSGARPAARELQEPYKPGGGRKTDVLAAAWIPTWEHSLHASDVLSDDGSRLFFNSNDALLPADTNGAQDVYEWEAPGAGSCTEASSAYFPQNGGCLYLISSGESPFESEFWEAASDGRDVFFTTASSLLPQDPGSIDLYDARVDGGFPQPTVPASCEGEACQSPAAPPDDPTPASSAFEGAGNVKEGTPKPRCRKPKVRRHGRCVARHAHKHHRNHNRRAPR